MPREAFLELLSISLSIVALIASLTSLIRLRRSSELLESALEGYGAEKSIRRISREYSRRLKKRYVVFEVVPVRLSFDEVENAIREAALKLLGYKGLSELNMKLVYFNEERSRGIVRVRWNKKYVMLAVLSFIRKIKDERVMFIPIATSGSLKRAKRLAEVE